MNIFFLDEDPVTAALYHCDKHVLKMTIESAQMLCTTVHALARVGEDRWGRINRIMAGKVLYRPTHHKHPMTVWTQASAANYDWLVRLLDALLDQYFVRWRKLHGTSRLVRPLREIGKILPFAEREITGVPLCMPDIYKDYDDVVGSYRRFYCQSKHAFAKWTTVAPPPWWAPPTGEAS